jgi:hypothetical protein
VIPAPATRALAAVVAASAVAFALSACAPEPTATSTPTVTASEATGTPEPTASATPIAPADEITLPAGCEQIYSPAMLAELQSTGGPLNDPGITLYATKIVPALEILESGAPTLRCTWGRPGDSGLATNVTIVDSAQAATVLDSLTANGYGCEDSAGGTLCRIESQSVDYDDNVITQGETHFLRGNGWITTAWITFAPTGYTEDIAATLWG